MYTNKNMQNCKDVHRYNRVYKEQQPYHFEKSLSIPFTPEKDVKILNIKKIQCKINHFVLAQMTRVYTICKMKM